MKEESLAFSDGSVKIEIDSIAESNLYSAPRNFGISVNQEVKQIVPANLYRARLHFVNSGAFPVHVAFGLRQNCIPGECLYLPPGAGWNDERVDKAVVSSTVWATTGGDESGDNSSLVTGVEVNWIG